MKKQQLLETALATVTNRGSDYGDAYINHKRIAEMWTVILGIDVKPHQVVMAMRQQYQTLQSTQKDV